MAFNVSIPVAYVALYGVLLLFTVLAVFPFRGSRILSCLLYGNRSATTTNAPAKNSTDHFLSARNSAGSFAIGMSFFASGMGAWVRV
jgi:hypothetical protein